MPNWKKVVVSGSDAALNSLQVTNSVTASLFSGSLWNLQNSIVGHIPYFSSSQVLADSAMFQIEDANNVYSIVINQNGVSSEAPEALYVYQPSTSSYNVISGKGNLNRYLQLNIQNTNQGVSASSDIVATANNGDENGNYIDMGINSENFNTNFIGGANDAYVYSIANNLHIGSAATGSQHLGFFVGGDDVELYNKLSLYPNNQHQMSGSLGVSGSVTAHNFTGSLQGTASFAVSASWAPSDISIITVADEGTTQGTASYFNFTGSGVTVTVSSNTASINIPGGAGSTFPFTGSAIISGSLIVTGSIAATAGITGSLFGTASNVQGGSQYYVPLWNTNSSLSSSYLNQSGSILKTVYNGQDKGLTLDYNTDSFILGNAGTGNNTYLQVFDGGSVININTPNYTYFAEKVGIRIIPTNPGLAISGALEVTGPGTSKFMNNNVQIDGNIFMSGSNRLIYNDSTTNSMLFGFFDGGNIYGPYYQIFGNQYANITQRGSAEFVYDNRNGGGSGFNIASFNGSTWTRKFRVDDNGAQVTGSLEVTNGITGSLFGTASFADNTVSASFALTASHALSSSYASNADLLDGHDSTYFATTGSNTFIGDQIVTGSLFTTGSNRLIGTTTLTGSLNITGSTIQIGDNNLFGNTSLSGSIIISGSQNPSTPTIQIFGDTQFTGVARFNPISRSIDNSISASYIYVSGSTQDLYFSQNGSGYNNVTRLRWIEGNLYTGLLHGGLVTSQSSTVYQVSSGSGIIVNLNASLSNDPYPTIQYLNWPNLSASISAFTSSYQQVFVGIDSTNNIYQQGIPFSDGQFDTIINIGNVLFQNQSTINGVKTQPSTAYGFEQAQNVFNRAFGPLKLSGYTLAPSGSSTGSLIVGSGTAYSPGSNYIVDPNEPYYTVDNGTNVSKIFRYYQSGSSWVYLTNAGAGFATIDPSQYSNSGSLASVGNNNWSIQRVFWFPNSVTKAIVVYYGNQIYATEVEAVANINFEPFVEAPNTAANAIYLGAVIIKGNGVFTSAADYKILPGGLFRQVGGSGGGGSTVTQTLSGLSDVSISGPTNLQPLVYSTTAGKWINASNVSASLYGNAQTATSASHAVDSDTAISSSFATNATSASFAISSSFATSASVAISSSFATSASQAVSASFTISSSYAFDATTSSYAVSSSFATSASVAISSSFATSASVSISSSFATSASVAISSSFALDAISSSFATNALTASYALNALSSSFATSASQAVNADTAITASYILNAVSASFATNAISASYALNSTSASYALNSTSASYALDASTATTASYVLQAVSASYALNADTAITASYVLNAVSASFATNSNNAVTASYVLNAVSASFATSSSFASTSSFANNFTVANTLTLDDTLTDYATVASSIAGLNNLFTQATGSYTSAFFKYTVSNGANARSGEVMAVWNGATSQLTDFSTLDIGTTSPVTASIALVGTDVQFNIQTNTSGWRIKSLATFM